MYRLLLFLFLFMLAANGHIAQTPYIQPFKFENAVMSALPGTNFDFFWKGRLGDYHFIENSASNPCDEAQILTRHVHPDSAWRKTDNPTLPVSNLGAYPVSIGRNRLWRTNGNACPGLNGICPESSIYLSTPQNPDPVNVLKVSTMPIVIGTQPVQLLGHFQVTPVDSLHAVAELTHKGINGAATTYSYYKTVDAGLSWETHAPPVWPFFHAGSRFVGMTGDVARVSTTFDFQTFEDWPLPPGIETGNVRAAHFSGDTLFLLALQPDGKVWFSQDKGQVWNANPTPFPGSSGAYYSVYGKWWWTNPDIGLFCTDHPLKAGFEVFPTNTYSNPYHKVLAFDYDGAVIVDTEIGMMHIGADGLSVSPYYQGLVPGDLYLIDYFKGRYWGRHGNTLFTSKDGIDWAPYYNSVLQHRAVNELKLFEDQAFLFAREPNGSKYELYYDRESGSGWALIDSIPFYSPKDFTPFKEQWVLVNQNAKTIYRTKDEGKTWTDVKVPSYFPLETAALFNDTIVVAGRDGQLARSVDGGVSWESLSSPIQMQYANPKFVVKNHFLYFGSEFGPTVFRSKDYGSTWEAVNSVFPATGWTVTDSLLVLVNRGHLDPDSIGLYLSDDDGETWYWTNETPFPDVHTGFIQHGNRFIISKFSCVDRGIYTVVSDSLFQLLFNPDSTSFSLEPLSGAPLAWNLAPNPASHQVCIHSLKQPSAEDFDEVLIFDLHGVGMKAQKMNAPCLSVENLPEGAYFVCLRNKNTQRWTARKLVIAR